MGQIINLLSFAAIFVVVVVGCWLLLFAVGCCCYMDVAPLSSSPLTPEHDRPTGGVSFTPKTSSVFT